MSKDLINYYRDRALEYERIYDKPERQEDLRSAANLLKEIFQNKEVLEIACGTGFWTQFIAETARSILATDINDSVIHIAKQKEIKNPALNFQVADLYSFHADRQFESLFGGFIYSHILKQDLDHFFKTLNGFVKKNGLVVLMDNSYVEGSNQPVTETDEQGNTYQTRSLDDGSVHKVLKNFATENYLTQKLKNVATDLKFIQLKYFWILSYKPV
ncbi:hypothetical protein CNR22_16545 [Sphingobacteriaceae bacterium]|nr:hypothetical protein CNR22_16545 [Sphingobacteriaceae bacterium]